MGIRIYLSDDEAVEVLIALGSWETSLEDEHFAAPTHADRERAQQGLDRVQAVRSKIQTKRD